jgi:glycosyltransferase involved in cell wall biosynthesis
MNRALVSVVVPTLNAAAVLRDCLASVAAQSYTPIEVIVADGHSSDETQRIASEFTDKFLLVGGSRPPAGVFSAPAQRNQGATHAMGEFIYHVDADMTLPVDLVDECVKVLHQTEADAVIVPERSFGKGYWARIKSYERGFYTGNDLVEAPRFIRTATWRALGGFDTGVGGNDDWDFHIRLKAGGYKVVRVTQVVLHNEGRLSLRRLALKRFMYGRYTRNFVAKHGLSLASAHYNPFRRYLLNKSILLSHPVETVGLIAMRSVEYGAGLAGLLKGPPSNAGRSQ